MRSLVDYWIDPWSSKIPSPSPRMTYFNRDCKEFKQSFHILLTIAIDSRAKATLAAAAAAIITTRTPLTT